MQLSDAHLRAMLDQNGQVVDDLCRRADAALVAGRDADGARWCAVIADVAARQHTGWFALPELERLICQLGVGLGGGVPTPTDGPIVHVVSAGSGQRVDDVVGQMRRHGEHEVLVTDRGDDPLREARRLRSELSAAGMVVLHLEPCDIAPLVAVAGWIGRPPVVIVNHHDTVFWPGVSVADLVVSHRAVGSALCVDRRFVGPGRTMVAPANGAPPEAWRRFVGQLWERAHAVLPAWLPTASLPPLVTERDLDLVRSGAVADRADGLLGAMARHADGLSPRCMPEISVVVASDDVDAAIATLHQVLDTWTRPSPPHLVVLDLTGRNLPALVGELGGVAVCSMTTATQVGIDDLLADGVKWAIAPVAAVIKDDVDLAPGCWDDALEALGHGQLVVADATGATTADDPSIVLVRTGIAGDHDTVEIDERDLIANITT